ncbi:MAG TPA: ABC transporter ATP-binding protein [Candidatus Limnocylindrales bacterium]
MPGGAATTAASTLYQPPRDTPLAVDVRHVSRRYGMVAAVDDISLQVPVGSIVGVIGPSGSGKTTTIRLITGVLRPTSGDLRVLGQQPRRFSRSTRERIGYMPQQLVLYPELTARENVDFVGALFGMLPLRRHRRTEQVLRLVQLWDVRDRLVAQMSGGMQSRVALACALVHDPELLILDEPTAGIDPLLRQEIWSELRRLRDAGVTVLVTTQYVSEAEYCDWVALISEGQLVAYASPDEVRRQALGGDVIQVVTTADFDAARLPRIEDVVAVRQVGPRELLAISSDAGQALPRVVEAIDDAGGEVEWSREYRPTFDEVFAELVIRHAQRGRTGGGAPVAGAGSLRLPRGLRR